MNTLLAKVKWWFVKPTIPFEKISKQQRTVIMIFWIGIIFASWMKASVYSDVKIIPSPLMVLSAFRDLYYEGLIKQFAISITLCFQSIGYALVISLIIAYLSPLPLIKPLAQAISKLRYVPMIGITYYLTLAVGGGRPMQVTILSMFMSFYFITSIMAMIGEIPIEAYDLARTMGCSRWEMLYKVVIKGRIDCVIEILRQNLAITWMMFVSVEILVIAAGGIGIWMKNSERFGNQERIFALQILVFLFGTLLDYLLSWVKTAAFRFSRPVKSL